MSVPDRTFTNGHGQRNGDAPRMPDGPITPPQNLEAEQSVLGAVLLSDTALPALIIDERLHPEDFYREAHGIVFAAMLELHSGGEPVDALTLVEHLKQAGRLEDAGGHAAIDLLASSVPAVGHVRQYARIVRENAMLRRLLRAAYEIQARVHSHDAPPRELVDIAERSMSAPIYDLLKRPDELFVVEHAHLQPRFVEDSVRHALRDALNTLPQLDDGDFLLSRQVNFETIHVHDVVAERYGTAGELRSELASGEPSPSQTTLTAWLSR